MIRAQSCHFGKDTLFTRKQCHHDWRRLWFYSVLLLLFQFSTSKNTGDEAKTVRPQLTQELIAWNPFAHCPNSNNSTSARWVAKLMKQSLRSWALLCVYKEQVCKFKSSWWHLWPLHRMKFTHAFYGHVHIHICKSSHMCESERLTKAASIHPPVMSLSSGFACSCMRSS